MYSSVSISQFSIHPRACPAPDTSTLQSSTPNDLGGQRDPPVASAIPCDAGVPKLIHRTSVERRIGRIGINNRRQSLKVKK